AQLGVRRQAEVVVGREIDDLLAVEAAHRRLLVVEHAQLEVGALLLQLVELVGEVGQRIGAGGRACHEGLRVRFNILSRGDGDLTAKRRGKCRASATGGSNRSASAALGQAASAG